MLDDYFNPKRKEASDKLLKYLADIDTPAIRQAQEQFVHNRIEATQFMNVCVDEGRRIQREQEAAESRN